MQLGGCVALVTGGSGDLGSAIVRALAAQGIDVALTYVSRQEQAEQIAAEVEEMGQRAWAVRLDQSDPAMVEEVVGAVVERLGRLDILVNNAAWNIGISFSDLDALTPDIWDRIYHTNARGPFLLARAAARPMRDQQRGRIVNIASIGGVTPSGSSIAYSTSKAALIHLTQCLAVALAPHVLVNCVAPGLIEGTRMAARLPPAMARMAKENTLLGRTATVEDLADQVVAFCRTDSTTGQTLVIDGGLFVH
jgi:3-oxoacyl-[acyl-carrier protein] reductase